MPEITPELQKRMDEIIAKHGGLEAFMAKVEQREAREKQEELGFWQGINAEELKTKYVGADNTLIQHLRPVWDLRRSALRIGDMANQIDPEAIPLYLATRDAILRYSRYGDWELTMEHGVEAKFLRVLGNWEQGRALTPPLLWMWGDQLAHRDGHHRMKIALMSGAPVIPFYCKEAFDFPGIEAAPPSLHSEAAWSAV